ncbi:hypothetical protein SeMB42_g07499 [Synchytrium endobioticum]|uniref:Uncharacterized protein n=1 Tax=Synchytrium endobioticum TaxID=286115 RepID=A0A507BV40_9FUNG|nr:hypothetical protein SeMB42_g07499 [Synchytrium endobioticum]
MSRLHKFSMCIILVVYLMPQVFANYAPEMLKSATHELRIKRVSLAQKTDEAVMSTIFFTYYYCLTISSEGRLTQLQEFVLEDSPLDLKELTKEPRLGMTKEHLEYLMEYNAFQYEKVRALYVQIFKVLLYHNSRVDPERAFGSKTQHTFETRLKTLTELRDRYIDLAVKSVECLAIVAPYLLPISGPGCIWHSQELLNNIQRYLEQIARARFILRYETPTFTNWKQMAGLPLEFTATIPREPQPGMPITYLRLVEAYSSLLLDACHYQLYRELLSDPAQIQEIIQYWQCILGAYQQAIAEFHFCITGVDAGVASFDPTLMDINEYGNHHWDESIWAHDMPHHSCTPPGVGPSHASASVSGTIRVSSFADLFSHLPSGDRVGVSQLAGDTTSTTIFDDLFMQK